MSCALCQLTSPRCSASLRSASRTHSTVHLPPTYASASPSASRMASISLIFAYGRIDLVGGSAARNPYVKHKILYHQMLIGRNRNRSCEQCGAWHGGMDTLIARTAQPANADRVSYHRTDNTDNRINPQSSLRLGTDAASEPPSRHGVGVTG
jgi:hypothetical protein